MTRPVGIRFDNAAVTIATYRRDIDEFGGAGTGGLARVADAATLAENGTLAQQESPRLC